MKRFLFAFILLCSSAAMGQSIFVYPATVTAPRGTYQSCTAIVTGTNLKTVHWTTTGGTLVGVNPGTANEPQTIAVYDTTAETDTVTATSTTGSVTGTCAVTFTASPTPLSTWPRFLFNSSNLSAMQTKFTAGSPQATALKNNGIAGYTPLNGIMSWSCGGGAGGSTGLPVPAVTDSVVEYAITNSGYHTSQIALTLASGTTSTFTDGILSGFTGGAAFLNGQYIYITSASGTLITGNVKLQANASATATGSLGLLQLSGQGLVNTVQEGNAYSFSMLALIDPSDGTYNWGCYAHDLSMYLFNIYPLIDGPYYFPQGANQWSDYSFTWAVLADWLRGSGAISTTGDLAQMRTFYTYLTFVVQTGENAPNPQSTYNSSEMFLGSVNNNSVVASGPADMSNMRTFGGNNYNMSRMLIMAATGLAFNDTTGDAPNNPTGVFNTCAATRYQVCLDGTAGSLIAYWKYTDGAMLYDYWAKIEDPNVAWQAYQATYANLPTQPVCEAFDLATHPCFGDGRDGATSEGNYYDYSIYRMRWLFNLLHTSGNDDPLVNGPQISAGTSSWWDMKYIRDLTNLVGPVPQTHQLGQYSPLQMGDGLTYYWDVNSVQADAALLYFDSLTGRTDRAVALKWIEYNLAFGGPLGTLYSCTSYCGWIDQIGNGLGGNTALDMFLALPSGNPVGGTLPSDPRPSLPTDIYDASFNQNGVVRTAWPPSNGTTLSYWFNNSQEAHEYNYDGRFDVNSCLSGTCEYITKGRSIFNNYNANMVSANLAQNELGILNSTGTANSADHWYAMELNGGQFPQQNFGTFSSSVHSELPGYAAAIGSTGGTYNGEPGGYYGGFNDVASASRSIVYLRSLNQIVYYDRAAVGHSASVQTLNQIATGTPTISGNTATWPTQSATQKASFTSLLPSGGTLSNAGLPCFVGTATCSGGDLSIQLTDWEPAAVLQVAPSGTPTNSQFLSTLQWGASSFTPATATLVQSTSGQGFDGAILGTSCILFERGYPATFTGTTYAASGCTTHYVSDLTPNTLYTITGAGTPASATSDTAGVLTFAATGTGNITVSAGSSSGGATLGGNATLGGGAIVQ